MKQLPVITAATQIADVLAVKPLDAALLHQIMTDAHGNETWRWRDAYDATEAAVVIFLRRHHNAMWTKAGDAGRMLKMIDRIAGRLPTFSRRTPEQQKLQQFSTPPALAYVTAVAARIQPGDVAMEPSAGTGLLAIMAENAGASLILNELCGQRTALLQALWPGLLITSANAEHIHDYLDEAVTPNVVVMNPPFSTSPDVQSHRPIVTGRHLGSALQRLSPNGRLVTITGASFKPETVCGDGISLAFSSTIDGKVFQRAGTSVSTRLSVFDKIETGHGDRASLWPDPAPDVHHLLERLAHLPPRASSVGRSPVALPIRPPVQAAPVGSAGRATQERRPARIIDVRPLDYTVVADAKPASQNSDRVYEPYEAERLCIPGAGKHPTDLVQSAAMAGVLPPAADYRPILPTRIVTEGVLSHPQLETVIYAGAAHSEFLPGRYTVDPETNSVMPAADTEPDSVRFRQAFSLGDGTGAGKGRQLAGIILDNAFQGRMRAVWITKSAKLIEATTKDWQDLGGDPDDVFDLGRIKAGAAIPAGARILFLTYKLLSSADRGGRSRLDQLVAWLGADFDGVIAFDESHAMANAGGGEDADSLFGQAKASQQGIAGLSLQISLPSARVVYASATGATRVKNLAYAMRLGLWGQGTAFPQREAFVTAMTEGGTAAMEVVARDLKAKGLYMARVLSFEGVEIKPMTHQLTADQRRIYDIFAESFAIIYRHLDKALEATGVVSEQGATRNGRAKAAAHSAFQGNAQRFFGQLIIAMQCPTLIRSIERDLEDGHAPVIQLVSTHEAMLKRRIARIPASQWDDVQVDCTPTDLIADYLMSAFPVVLQEEYQPEGSDEIRSRPVKDQNGDPVICKEAAAMRDHLIARIASLPPIQGALDQIIQRFGTDRVAEITGRTRRLVWDGFRQKIEKRSPAANLADGTAFMAGAKDMLVFSDAGGTGRSFHADLAAANQRRRIHYLIEPGWRADNAIQGLGRTHRSNQRVAPVFRPCSTDVRGQKRFIATIARRLAELGALTRGQRQTGDNGIFRPEDNLESDYAKMALRAFLLDLCAGRIDDCSAGAFEEATGLRLFDREGNRREDLPPIQRVLNRMLALPIDLQNRVFDAFEQRHIERITAAKEAGTYDLGLETLRAESMTLVKREEIVRHAGGALTELVEVRSRYEFVPTSLTEAKGSFLLDCVRNELSGKVAVACKSSSTTNVDGRVERRIRMTGPNRTWSISEEEYRASTWSTCRQDTHARLWQAEIDQLPRYQEYTIYLATGMLLPLWDRMPKTQLQVRRLTTDCGQTFLGLLLDGGELSKFLDAVGHQGGRPQLGIEDIQRAVMNDREIIGLVNGWHLRRSLHMGKSRLELVGPTDLDQEILQAWGVVVEIVDYRARYWVPVDHDLAVFRKILDAHPAQSGATSAAAHAA